MAENPKAPEGAEEHAPTARKAPARKAATKAPVGKPAAEKPARKAAIKAPVGKPAAEEPAGKAAIKAPVGKPAAEKPTRKAAAEKPAKDKAPAAKVAAPAVPAARSNRTEGAGGTLKLHHLRPAPGSHTAKTRVGRGEASKGKTAGRGTKGTKARYQVSSSFEGGQMPLHMRLPKLRGFTNPFRTQYQVVNLDRLAQLYPKGGAVTAEDLVAKGAVRKGAPVKVLGSGDVTVKLDVSVEAVSASARDKILAAGGTVQD